MRRYVMLVKHKPGNSKIPDYLVVRDEISSPQPVWWNLHMLARDIRQSDQVISLPGQLDVDVDVHFVTPRVERIEKRQWGWSKERNKGSLKNWKGEQYEREHFGHYVPTDFKRGTWGKSFEHSGEMGKWLRVQAGAGESRWFVVLMPRLQDASAANVEKLSATSARISLGNESEIVHLGSDGEYQAAVERGGRETILLKADQVKPILRSSLD